MPSKVKQGDRDLGEKKPATLPNEQAQSPQALKALQSLDSDSSGGTSYQCRRGPVFHFPYLRGLRPGISLRGNLVFKTKLPWEPDNKEQS